jgi:phosphoglycerate dehydrogenase-like enzyme
VSRDAEACGGTTASRAEPTEVLVFSPKGADAYVEALSSSDANIRVVVATTRDEALRHLPTAEVLLSSNAFPVDGLDRAQRLRWIHVQGAGVNAWTEHGIPAGVRLSRTTGTFGPRMAQYALTYVGVVAQRVRQLFAAQSERRWSDPDVVDLQGRRLGVAGIGAIGGSVARLARAFGMHVVGLSRTEPAALELDGWYPVTRLHDFLAELDFLIIVLPLTPHTRGMFDRAALEALPDHAWLVNMGRGPLVVEGDLLEALERRALGGAVLDVFDTEPLPAEHPFWGRDDVVVTPHCSGGTITSEVVEIFVRNLSLWRTGAPLENEVDLERAY